MMEDHEYEARILEYQDRIATLSDDELRAAYEASDAEAGDPWQDALAAAMQERNLDE
jgi:ribosomal protein L12E/L44/L45/RPP1/RPP2